MIFDDYVIAHDVIGHDFMGHPVIGTDNSGLGLYDISNRLVVHGLQKKLMAKLEWHVFGQKKV